MQVVLGNYKYFFFNDTATTKIYTLSLHDALPILVLRVTNLLVDGDSAAVEMESLFHSAQRQTLRQHLLLDRKSTRLNSSHANISYAVFCLKKINYIFIYNVSSSSSTMSFNFFLSL